MTLAEPVSEEVGEDAGGSRESMCAEDVESLSVKRCFEKFDRLRREQGEGKWLSFSFDYGGDLKMLFSREKGSVRQGDLNFVKTAAIERQRMSRGDRKSGGELGLWSWTHLAFNPGSSSF